MRVLVSCLAELFIDLTGVKIRFTPGHNMVSMYRLAILATRGLSHIPRHHLLYLFYMFAPRKLQLSGKLHVRFFPQTIRMSDSDLSGACVGDCKLGSQLTLIKPLGLLSNETQNAFHQKHSHTFNI